MGDISQTLLRTTSNTLVGIIIIISITIIIIIIIIVILFCLFTFVQEKDGMGQLLYTYSYIC